MIFVETVADVFERGKGSYLAHCISGDFVPEEIYRVAVRGIIFIDGKLLLIENSSGEIEEKRLSTMESMIWHQISRLFFCEVHEKRGECAYSENEKKYEFRQVFYTVEEALKKNEETAHGEVIPHYL